MKRNKNKRRKYIVDKAFQFRFVGFIFLMQLLVAVAVGLGVSFWYYFVFDAGKIVCQTNTFMLVQWAIIVAFTSVGLIIGGIVYTHRIIGPIFRVRSLLRAAAAGDIPSGNIALRKNDCFKGLEKDLAACFKKMGQNGRE